MENVGDIHKATFEMMALLAHGVTKYYDFSNDDLRIFLNIAWMGLTLTEEVPIQSIKILLNVLKPANADISEILPPQIIKILCSLVKSENLEIAHLAIRTLSIATSG